MRVSRIVKRSLFYYWPTQVAIVLGVAISVSTLAGALLVGDSVQASLKALILERLGKTHTVIFATTPFQEDLTRRIQTHASFSSSFSSACPIMVGEGTVVHADNKQLASRVQIYGVDERFWDFHGLPSKSLGNRTALLSRDLAQELDWEEGDYLLVTLRKQGGIPSETLHGKKDQSGSTFRLKGSEILEAQALGEFSILQRGAKVWTLFLPLREIQRALEQPERANALLLSSKKRNKGAQDLVENLLQESLVLEDTVLRIRKIDHFSSLSIEHEGGLLDQNLSAAAHRAGTILGMKSQAIFSYVVNTIGHGYNEIPYSLVTGLEANLLEAICGQSYSSSGQTDSLPPIWINDWAAKDLGVSLGSLVQLDYHLWDYRRGLSRQKDNFFVAGIVPLSGPSADRDLVPEYRGISQTASISQWDPPFPVDLTRIRSQDEDYWEQYRTTPKAFLTLKTAQDLWASRFGKLTSLRIKKPKGLSLDKSLSLYRKSLLKTLKLGDLGFSVEKVRDKGITASRGTIDFGAYFLYFSFFLVVSSLLLTILFFKLGIDQRLSQIGLYKALGLSESCIRWIFAAEGLILALIGSILGLAGAVSYGWMMMWGLRSHWVGAVGTTRLSLHVEPETLLLGGVSGVVVAFLCIVISLRRLGKTPPRTLLSGENNTSSNVARRKKSLFLALGFGFLAIILMLTAFLEWIGQVPGFFGSGALLLTSLLGLQWYSLTSNHRKSLHGKGLSVLCRMGLRNIGYKPYRSILSIGLVALATFIIVTVGVFRREDTPVFDPQSGTGGFSLVAETSAPIFLDPNEPVNRRDLNLEDTDQTLQHEQKFWSFRLRPGDDASCRNLYRPVNPRILGATLSFLQLGRFSFHSSLAANDQDNPWLLLKTEENDQVIPAIADATSMAYSLNVALGEEIVLARDQGDPIRLKLVGALSDSILQGEIIISEKHFLRLFPKQEGYRYFLIETPPSKTQALTRTLEESLFEYGFDATPSHERLASFHRVENTYLSTFQTLGGLGLLMGTLGTAVVLLRNVLERKKELALMRAVGYQSVHLGIMILAENFFLVTSALAIGTVSALVAVAPVLSTRESGLSLISIGFFTGLVLLIGLTASSAAVCMAVRAPVIRSLRSE